MKGKTVRRRITRGVLAAVLLLALLLTGWPVGMIQAAPGDTWLTFAGGESHESANSFAVDGSGNTYITGTGNCNWGNPIVSYSGAGTDVFVAKFNSNGTLEWNTFFGVEGIEGCTSSDIALDGDGNIYVVGVLPGDWGSEGFINKYASDGSLAQNIKLGASGEGVNRYGTYVNSIKVSGDYIYVAGSGLYTWEGVAPIRGLSNFPNSNEAFVAKFNTNLVRQWYTFLGGNSDDGANRVVIDGSGNIYVTGSSGGAWSVVEAPAAPRKPYFEGADGFAAMLDTDGNLDWHTFFRNEGKSLARDAAGNLYITGDYIGVDWGETDPLRNFSGNRDAFVVKLAATGAYLWHTFLGASNSDRGYGIAVSGSNVYVTGESVYYYEGWSNAGTLVREHSGNKDAFLVQLDTAGSIQWHSFYGGTYDDSGQVIRVLGDYIYVSGTSNNTWGNPVRDYSSGADAFIVKLNSNGQLESPANLTSLTENLAAGFNPAFAGGTYTYTLAAAPGEASVTLAAALDGADITYTYGGSAHATGADIPLAFGQTVVTINVTKAGCTATTYTVTVTRYSNNATVTSAAYTVSAGGTANETIVNVPFGTAKAAFLANLTKGQANQAWNTDDIADPVETDDTLVVTAQDGTTTVTYTVTVNAAPNNGWLTFAGSEEGESAIAMTVDGSGNVFVVGTGHDNWGVEPINAATGDYTYTRNGVLAKFTSSGELAWHTFFRIPEATTYEFCPHDVAVDSSGNIYVVGEYEHQDESIYCPQRAFVYKFNSSGVYVDHLVWGYYSKATAVTVSGNDVYVTGGTEEQILAGVPMIGGSDIFLVKLNTSLNTVWHTYLGGQGDDWAEDVEIDSSGCIYLAGHADGRWGDVDPVQSDNGETQMFAAKVNSGGSLEWYTYFGHGSSSEVRGLALNGSTIYLTGDSDVTWGDPIRGFTPVSNTMDAFVVKLDNDGVFQWNTFLGGAYPDSGWSVAANVDNVYVIGESQQSWGDSPLRPKAPGWAYEAFVAKLSSDGNLEWHTFLSGSGKHDIAVSYDYIYALGDTRAYDWGNPLNPHTGGFEDIFLAKLTSDGQLGIPANLTSLTENMAGDFNPAFAGGTYEYTLSAAPGEATVTLEAALDEADITYTYGGSAHATGADIPLAFGETVVTINVTKAGCTATTYTVTVTRYSNNATVTSAAYNVSAEGTATETIVNVPFGTAKAAFLANLTKGQANQAWNTDNIADPVVSNNTLIVTAQDGTTIVTYTVTVNDPSDNATVTSAVYTVNAAGGTITNVPHGTAKAAFLANLAKGQADQAWNTDNIADPVVSNNTLVVTAQDGTTIVTYTVTVNAAPNNGGGGGGGGGGFAPQPVVTPDPEPPAGKTIITGSVNNEGVFTAMVNIVAEDGEAVIDIPAGTVGLDADLQPLAEITMVPLAEPPAPVPGGTVAFMYDLGPDGATFEPPISLSMPLPEGADPAIATIAYWDGNEWIILETTYDPETGLLTAQTTHFTVFGTLILEPEPTVTPEPEKPVEPAPTTAPAPVTATAKPAPAVTTTPAAAPVEDNQAVIGEDEKGGIAWYWWLVIAAGAVVIIATVLIELRQRRQIM